MSLPDPVVFVGGSERSGTTLLRNMLTAHPSLAVPDESPFVRSVHWMLAGQSRLHDLDAAWAMIRNTNRFRQWRLPPEEVESLLREHPPASYDDLMRILFAAYARWRGKPSSGDKTTGNALYFEWLAERFPASRFVHVVRDPRAVCMSRSVQIFNRGGLSGAARHWRSRVAAARAAAARLGDRLLEVRYERLVANPAEELERLCTFIGVPFAPELLNYGRSSEVLPQHHQDVHAREPLQTDLRRWRQELSRDDISVIETIAGELMEDVGYPRVVGRITPRAAAVIATEWVHVRHDRWLEDFAGARARRGGPG
jgi:hypothetical protein